MKQARLCSLFSTPNLYNRMSSRSDRAHRLKQLREAKLGKGKRQQVRNLIQGIYTQS